MLLFYFPHASRKDLDLIQDEGQKRLPTSFSSVISTNAGYSPQTFLTCGFNYFATLVQNFKVIPSVSPRLLNLNQEHPSKKFVYLTKYL